MLDFNYFYFNIGSSIKLKSFILKDKDKFSFRTVVIKTENKSYFNYKFLDNLFEEFANHPFPENRFEFSLIINVAIRKYLKSINSIKTQISSDKINCSVAIFEIDQYGNLKFFSSGNLFFIILLKESHDKVYYNSYKENFYNKAQTNTIFQKYNFLNLSKKVKEFNDNFQINTAEFVSFENLLPVSDISYKKYNFLSIQENNPLNSDFFYNNKKKPRAKIIKLEEYQNYKSKSDKDIKFNNFLLNSQFLYLKTFPEMNKVSKAFISAESNIIKKNLENNYYLYINSLKLSDTRFILLSDILLGRIIINLFKITKEKVKYRIINSIKDLKKRNTLLKSSRYIESKTTSALLKYIFKFFEIENFVEKFTFSRYFDSKLFMSVSSTIPLIKLNNNKISNELLLNFQERIKTLQILPYLIKTPSSETQENLKEKILNQFKLEKINDLILFTIF